jgi:phospholipid N-methyltransferase
MSVFRKLKGLAFFLGTSFKNLQTVGTFLPTGKKLANALVVPLEAMPGDARRIIEIGPGHGSLTRTIVQHMRERDTLTLVEIIPEFAKYLEKWRDSLEPQLAKRIRVVCTDILEFQDDPYDMVVCGAPFNCLPAPLVKQFYPKFYSLSHKDSVLTTYEYFGSKRLHLMMPFDRERIVVVENIVTMFRKRAELYKKVILFHLPPILITYYAAGKLYPDDDPENPNNLTVGEPETTEIADAETGDLAEAEVDEKELAGVS